MAVTYVVCLHKGVGVIGGSFSTMQKAVDFVGAKPNCGFEIQTVTTDAADGTIIGQFGIGNFVSAGPGVNNLGA